MIPEKIHLSKDGPEMILVESIYNRFINAWGSRSQILKAIEEFAELTQVLVRELLQSENPDVHYYHNPTFEEILGEIADVYLMIDQLAFIFGRPRVKEIITEKLRKALKRVEAHEERVKR